MAPLKEEKSLRISGRDIYGLLSIDVVEEQYGVRSWVDEESTFSLTVTNGQWLSGSVFRCWKSAP
jgi:hypothetical protein